MAEFPAMPLWTDAYLADTRHLSDAEHGRYLLLLIDMWRSPQRRFPNDKAWLARKFGRSLETFEAEIQPLLDEFCQCDGNWWTQKKMRKVWRKVQTTSAKQSDRAKSRWDKENGECRGNATPAMQPKPKPKHSESKKASPSSHPPNGGRKRNEYPEAFQLFWLAYPKRGTDTKASAFKAWDKARQAGTDVATLQDSAERYAAFAGSTGCETKHVQTWINAEGWTASYSVSKGNGHARQPAGKPGYIERLARRHFAPKEHPDPGPDPLEPEGWPESRG